MSGRAASACWLVRGICRHQGGRLHRTAERDHAPAPDTAALRRHNHHPGCAAARARLRGSGLAFSGNGMVASDVAAGTLALQWRSDLARDPASPPASPHEGFARGCLFAALWETFKVVYPIARLAPAQVTLSLQLTGQIAGTDPADPLWPGVETCLALARLLRPRSHPR